LRVTLLPPSLLFEAAIMHGNAVRRRRRGSAICDAAASASNRLFAEESQQLLYHPVGTLLGYSATAVLDNATAGVGCHAAP